MSSIAFVTYPETGHLNPTFRIAKTLKSRGHRISYIALPDFEDYIQSQDLDVFPIFAGLCPKGFIEQQVRGNVESLHALLARAKQAEQTENFNPAREVHHVIQNLAPDLAVIDLLLPDFVPATQMMGIQSILLNTQLYNPWKEKIRGYEPLVNLPELILCPREFDFPYAERKANSHYVESSIDLQRSEVEFPWSKISDDKPLIYCSFGSQSHLILNLRQFIDTLISVMAQKTGWQLVLSVGRDMDPDDFNFLTPNVVLVKRAPQLEMLKRASMMITHGGFNSIKESIYFGVPLITFPLIRDHPTNAARVAYHGLGIGGDIQNASLEQINSLIDRLDQYPSYRQNIKSMSKTFREMEKSQPSVQFIESVLRERN
jgi:uncharacterized protein (TIGR00661 family)